MKKQTFRLLLMGLLISALCTSICFAAGGETNPSGYGVLSVVPPILTIALAFATKQTIISMFAGIWLGAAIIVGGNPVDGLLHSFTDFIVPQIANSWNAGMLVIMVLIGGFMFMLSACGGTEAFGRWANQVAR